MFLHVFATLFDLVAGQVLLHYSAMYGHYADVEWLLQHGAQVVVYDQLAFHDFRVTIVKPSKPELEKAWLGLKWLELNMWLKDSEARCDSSTVTLSWFLRWWRYWKVWRGHTLLLILSNFERPARHCVPSRQVESAVACASSAHYLNKTLGAFWWFSCACTLSHVTCGNHARPTLQQMEMWTFRSQSFVGERQYGILQVELRFYRSKTCQPVWGCGRRIPVLSSQAPPRSETHAIPSLKSDIQSFQMSIPATCNIVLSLPWSPFNSDFTVTPGILSLEGVRLRDGYVACWFWATWTIRWISVVKTGSTGTGHSPQPQFKVKRQAAVQSCPDLNDCGAGTRTCSIMLIMLNVSYQALKMVYATQLQYDSTMQHVRHTHTNTCAYMSL